MPEPGREETVRVVALDKNFHMKCYKCEVGRASGPRGWAVGGAMFLSLCRCGEGLLWRH